jgi:hypothetical protein
MAGTASQASLLLQKQLKGTDPAAPHLFLLPFSPRSAPESWSLLLCLLTVSDLTKNPVDGFSAGLVDDGNIFEWQVTIIGPPDTL